MNDVQQKKAQARDKLIRQIGTKEERKLKARRKGMRSVWSGLGMSGLIGWSVALPTLLGAFLGLWIDRNYSSRFSWALMLLMIGLIGGCVNAWHWVRREDQQMHEEKNKDE